MAKPRGLGPSRMVGSVGDYTYRRTKYGTIVTEKIQKGRKMPSLVFLEGGGFWTRLPSSREQDRGRRREGLLCRAQGGAGSRRGEGGAGFLFFYVAG